MSNFRQERRGVRRSALALGALVVVVAPSCVSTSKATSTSTAITSATSSLVEPPSSLTARSTRPPSSERPSTASTSSTTAATATNRAALPKLVLDSSWVVTGASEGGAASAAPSPGLHIQVLTTIEAGYQGPRIVIASGPLVAPLGPRLTPPTIAAPLDETTAPGPLVRCYGAGHAGGEHAAPGRADATCEIDGVPVRLSASRLSDGDETTNVNRLFALAHLLAARPDGAPGFALGALPMRLHQIVEGDLVSTSFRTISFHQPSSDADASLSVYRGDAAMFAQLAVAATNDVSSTVAWDTSEPMTWVSRRVNEHDNRHVQIDGDVITDLRVTGLSLESIELVAKGIRTADDATWHALGLDAIALGPAVTVPTSAP